MHLKDIDDIHDFAEPNQLRSHRQNSFHRHFALSALVGLSAAIMTPVSWRKLISIPEINSLVRRRFPRLMIVADAAYAHFYAAVLSSISAR